MRRRPTLSAPACNPECSSDVGAAPVVNDIKAGMRRADERREPVCILGNDGPGDRRNRFGSGTVESCVSLIDGLYAILEEVQELRSLPDSRRACDLTEALGCDVRALSVHISGHHLGSSPAGMPKIHQLRQLDLVLPNPSYPAARIDGVRVAEWKDDARRTAGALAEIEKGKPKRLGLRR